MPWPRVKAKKKKRHAGQKVTENPTRSFTTGKISTIIYSKYYAVQKKFKK